MLLLSTGALGVVLIAVAVIVLIIILWFISTANAFKRYQVKIQEADSGIDVALTKRYDLLTKAFDVAKGYAKHEKETLYEVVKMRQGMSLSEKADVDAKLDKMGLSIKALAENYPTLRASEAFSDLQRAIKDAEEHLQAARRVFNSNVSSFNQMLVTFPNSVVGNYMKLVKAEFFKAEQDKKADVKINF